MGRAPCCDKANVKKGPWSPEEDAKLKAYIEEHGTGGNWIALPQKIGLKRCGKSCRLRWLNYLRPNIKHGGFSEEEDQIICSLYISIGSRWSIIAAQLPGRTDNDIKNYWNTRLKKKLLGKRREASQSRCLAINNGSVNAETNGVNQETPSQGLSASALERMQLHMQLQGLHNPFTFYNNPALWPKYHNSLGENILQSQDTDAISTTPVQQASEDTSSGQPYHHTSDPTKPQSMIHTASMQEDTGCSMLGFQSPSCVDTLMMNPNLDFNAFATAGLLPSELHDMLYDKDKAFGLPEENHVLPDHLESYRQIYGEKESLMNWWPAGNSFGEQKSSPAPQPDSLLQEYALRYDL